MGAELGTHAVLTRDIAAYHKLADRRDARVRTRLIVLGMGAVAAQAWVVAVALAGLVGLLGYAGRP